MVVTRLVDTAPRGGVGTATWIVPDGRTVTVSATLPTGRTPGFSGGGEDMADLVFALGQSGVFYAVHPDGSSTPVPDRQVADLLERPAAYVRHLVTTLDQEGPLHGSRHA